MITIPSVFLCTLTKIIEPFINLHDHLKSDFISMYIIHLWATENWFFLMLGSDWKVIAECLYHQLCKLDHCINKLCHSFPHQKWQKQSPTESCWMGHLNLHSNLIQCNINNKQCINYLTFDDLHIVHMECGSIIWRQCSTSNFLCIKLVFNNHIGDQIGLFFALRAICTMKTHLFVSFPIGILLKFKFFLNILVIRLLLAFPATLIACYVRL